MKPSITKHLREDVAVFILLNRFAFFFLLLVVITQGCKKDGSPLSPGSMSSEERKMQPDNKNNPNQINLVSDVSQYGATLIDTNLANAWGIAFGPTGGIWISANHKGLSVIYDKNGTTLRPPVGIPFGGNPMGGAPTGTVYNPTPGFVIPGSGQPAKFIFSAEDGTITAWNSGNEAITVADRSSTGSVYKGLELASDGGSWFLYATDFHNAKVDVFDQNFNYVSSKPFSDPSLPSGYAPFNIKTIGDNLFVTYALQKGPDNMDDQSGPGNGYVDIYKTNGTFVKRFASQGALNSPWGITQQDADDPIHGHGKDGDEHNILIGNFGDGHISIYGNDGVFKGQLKDNGKAITIEGLWALAYAPSNSSYGFDLDRIYFTAGPSDEDHGLFGYLAKK